MQELAEFFDNKIIKIKHQIDYMKSAETHQIMIEEISDSHLYSFTPITGTDISKLIKDYPIKSCPLDPLRL